MVKNVVRSINTIWLELLQNIRTRGLRTKVRGREMFELFNVVYEYHASLPVITIPERKLNYKFMAAEARWILDGDDRVATIAPYNSKIAAFAPLGDRFYGAYGPKFIRQYQYVLNALLADRCTRQAVMTFWTEAPDKGMDLACNDLLAFYIRDDVLFLSVTARSKDAWLGLPYDVFAFAMILYYVAIGYNQQAPRRVDVGTVTFLDVNCHLYADDLAAVDALLLAKNEPDGIHDAALRLPDATDSPRMLDNLLQQVSYRGFAGFV